jgi:glycosyltransferase involved in cell wall biosynthesis
VHCLIRRGKLADQLAARGVAVHLHGPGGLAQVTRRMAATIRETGSPDVLHCHNEGPAIAGALLRARTRIRKVVATRHGLVPPGQSRGRETKFWLAARLIDSVVAVCEAAHRNLEQGPLAIRRKIVTIYNGATPAERTAANSAEPPTDEFTLINVARHAQEKDLGSLLRGFTLARKQAPELRLMLVGSGPVSAEMQQLAAELGAAEDVRFLGERSDVGDLLAMADVFVLSSYSEGLPIALLEAMAAGVPQIVTDVGGMGEVVNMSGGGIVIPARDPAAITGAILRLRTDKEQRRVFGERSRDCYYQRFTPERMAAEYLSLYQR